MSFEKPSRIESEAGARVWLEDWIRAICEATTDRRMIEDAWVRVVKNHRGKEWPVAGVLCKEIAALMAERREFAPDRPLMIEKPKRTERSDSETDDLMWQIVETQVGYQAVLDDLGIFIWEDLRDRVIHGPGDLTETYMRHIRKVRRGFDDAYAKTNDVTHLRGLKGMGDHMLKKMEALRVKFLSPRAA